MEASQMSLFANEVLAELQAQQVEIDELPVKQDAVPMPQPRRREKTLNFLKIVPDDFVNFNRVRFSYKYNKTQVTLLNSFDTENNISYLRHVNRLDSLTMCNVIVNADILNELAPLNLRYLKFHNYTEGYQYTDEDLMALENWKELRRLNIYCSEKITDKGLKSLRKLEQLTHLYIYCNHRISEEGLVPLTFLPQLEKLFILDKRCGGTNITGEGWRKPGRATMLKELMIVGNWTDTGFDKLVQWINRLQQLENLSIRNGNHLRLPHDGLIRLEGLLGKPKKLERHEAQWEYIQLQSKIIEFMEQKQVPVYSSDMTKKFGEDKHFHRASELLIQRGILEKFNEWESEEDRHPVRMYRLTNDGTDIALKRAHAEIVEFFERKREEHDSDDF